MCDHSGTFRHAAWQLWNGELALVDALVLLGVFAVLMTWTIYQGMTAKPDALAAEISGELEIRSMSLRAAVGWLIAGLLLLILSSRVWVWGAVDIAQAFGVSDLIIGLTIVAVGTSLPELASSMAAACRVSWVTPLIWFPPTSRNLN